MAKTSKGRQKIQMVKMDNDSNLQVTFSKRRSGLFKKASELCTLCGADIAIIVFSPGDKAYSFGHPCVERVLERFLNGDNNYNPNSDQQISAGTLQFMEMQRNTTLRELNHQLGQLLAQLEVEKKRSEELKQMMRVTQVQSRCKGTIDDLSPSELEQLKASLEELKKNVSRQAERVLAQAANPPPFFGAAGPNVAGPSAAVIPYDMNNNIGVFNIGGGFSAGGGFNGALIPNIPYNYPFGRYY
ncbi:agamous-like MADS-box protein AGL62 [Punica granatum]|uniref:MADS-box domain-containing protein n=2 Tax=Punica granatum TaxID=22663 RepID=A0A218X2A9_PUNGR|nr:agamous-like MADS-box protein AGL62 [Punica granatum]OWM79127.1 hypothetical protein CDL15_Pgr003298 [Punica granatum]PKI49224.1 hypothetical protein CRG98_030373 [Punica granatum]